MLDKNGQIQEEGSHKVLVSQGGLYSTLWNHQTGGFCLQMRIKKRIRKK